MAEKLQIKLQAMIMKRLCCIEMLCTIVVLVPFSIYYGIYLSFFHTSTHNL